MTIREGGINNARKNIPLNNASSNIFVDTPVKIQAHVKAGKMVAVASTGLKRTSGLGELPTLAESGVPNFESLAWFGFVARAGTPPEIVQKLQAEIQKVLADPAIGEKLGQQGFEISPPLTPAQFAKIIADDLAKWVPIVKASGAKAD